MVSTEHGEQSTQGQRDRWGSPSLAQIAQALVCVDVSFAAETCMRHILDVIDEAGESSGSPGHRQQQKPSMQFIRSIS